jgi:hypothetical protein
MLVNASKHLTNKTNEWAERSAHALSRQLGNSTETIDRHYSKYSPLLNAEVHSGRKK